MKSENYIKNNFTIISNRIINDPALSWGAKGVASYLLSKDDLNDWKYRMLDIQAHAKDSMHVLQKHIKELEAVGFLIRNKTFDEKHRFNGWGYNFNSQYILQTEIPTDEKVVNRKSAIYNNTEGNNIDNNNPLTPLKGDGVDMAVDKKIRDLLSDYLNYSPDYNGFKDWWNNKFAKLGGNIQKIRNSAWEKNYKPRIMDTKRALEEKYGVKIADDVAHANFKAILEDAYTNRKFLRGEVEPTGNYRRFVFTAEYALRASNFDNLCDDLNFDK